MRGGDLRSEALFSYLSCAARVPLDHPLRPIQKIVDEALGALTGEFEKLYAKLGRPSIPPEKLLRDLLLQAFYSVRSERQLMEPLRGRCLAGKGERREIERWTDEDMIERHRARMQNAGKDMMRRRKALAEHPFGTLKCRAGYRHFLLRGFDKVRGEWSLMALCYNFSRVLRIIGLGPWMALLAQRAAKPLRRLIVVLLWAYRQINRYAAVLWRAFRNTIRMPQRGLGCV